ncbi:uncharacterized protein CEXT_744831 [Caerostris extrusa]|uniref:Uncharacterized protein n=1 Tax=Caerostris extrusa TaxID=172846 RepID=A0AAV4Y446_CAEEX|nr:uncharacterized protein CEXT_744831 [Caerostris extrusa]
MHKLDRHQTGILPEKLRKGETIKVTTEPSGQEPNTPNMDEILEGLLPQENLLKKLPKAASELMEVALNHYQAIFNLTDKKGITIDMRTEFRNNALSLVNLITKQSIKMAQLEGRICELHNNNSANNTVFVPKPSYAEKAKTAAPQKRDKSKPRVVFQQKFLTTIKPKVINSTNSSIKTKTTIQNKIDIRKINVGVKSVRPIRDGGIIIETINEDDLDKLIAEFKKQDELAGDYNIAKPAARWPQIICFDVATETTKDDILDNLRQQFPKEENIETDFIINHSFTNKRGKNWILEINPKMFNNIMKEKRINLDALQILAGIPPIEVTLRSLTKLYHLRYLQTDLLINNQLYSTNNLEKDQTLNLPGINRNLNGGISTKKKEGTVSIQMALK